MFIRLAWGIANGAVADLAIRMNRITKGGDRSWWARRAAVAILRMYSQGAGIDDGAAHLLESWGQEGYRCLAWMVEDDLVPEKYRGIAVLLVPRKQG